MLRWLTELDPVDARHGRRTPTGGSTPLRDQATALRPDGALSGLADNEL